MASHSPPPLLGTLDARELLNRWSRRSFLRLPDLGNKIDVVDLVPQSGYILKVQTQLESRAVGPATAPYTGGAIDEHGAPPDPWDIDVPRPADFEDRKHQTTVPHTERLQTCSLCRGNGATRCTTCNGMGKTTCPRCGGRGFNVQQRTVQTPGSAAPEVRVVHEPCGCFAGRVTCTWCNGSGNRTCGECRGSGKIKSFQLLSVAFEAKEQTRILHATDVPEAFLEKIPGDVLADKRQSPRVECPALAPEVDEPIRKLLEDAQAPAADPAQTRVLFQHLHVERVPIQEVRYRYRNVDRRLWICGQEVYAPGQPRPWGRFAIAAAVVAALGVGLVLALLHFL